MMEVDDPKYIVACLLCSDTEDLVMLPHRSRVTERMVGWIFVCLPCSTMILGGKLDITVTARQEKEDDLR